MEKLVLKLHLNPLGKRALNMDIKVLNVEANREDICREFIDKLFPMDLVESVKVVPSFENYKVGEKLIVVKDGKRCLGEINNFCSFDKSIHVKVYREDEDRIDYLAFHGDGKEFGHHKNKALLDVPVDGEIEALEFQLRNRPFHKILELLCEENAPLPWNLKAVNLPSWLSIDDAKEILKVIESKKRGYEFEHEENEF